MLVNMNTNVQSQNSRPSFGQINLMGGSREVLKTVFKADDWRKFDAFIDSQNLNNVDINLFGKGKKSLSARLITYNDFVKDKESSQRLFESVINFIKRCCNDADKLNAKVENVGDVDPEAIMNKASKL